MGLLGSLKTLALTTAANITTAIQKPTSYVSSTIKDITGKSKSNVSNLVAATTSKPLGTQVKNILSTTGTAASAVVGVGAIGKIPTATKIVSGGTKAAKSVGTTVSRAYAAAPKTTAVALVSAPSVATLLVSSPKARTSVAKVAKSAATGAVGTDLAKLIEGKSSISQFVSEHPVATGTAAAATALIVGKGLTTAGAIAAGNLLDNDEKTIIETKETKNETQLPTANNLTETPAATSPQTPETQRIVSTSTTSPKKRHKKAITRENKISQRVNVLVNTTGIKNTNYIKKSNLN